MTLEEYLNQANARGVIDHLLRTQVVSGKITFSVHPADISGEMLDFIVDGNRLIPAGLVHL